jgi:hypothetical protein
MLARIRHFCDGDHVLHVMAITAFERESCQPLTHSRPLVRWVTQNRRGLQCANSGSSLP